MRRSDVSEVIALAKEVEQLANDLLTRDRVVRSEQEAAYAYISTTLGYYSAALRRRSMDLTRSLARLRNPWRPS